jgi:hypothetical protein
MNLPSFITKNTPKQATKNNTPLDIEKLKKKIIKKEEIKKKEVPIKRDSTKTSLTANTVFPIKVVSKPHLPIKHIIFLSLSILFFLSGLFFYLYVNFFMR